MLHQVPETKGTGRDGLPLILRFQIGEEDLRTRVETLGTMHTTQEAHLNMGLGMIEGMEEEK